MSEIRRTTTIEEIDVPPQEPLVSLADVLTAEFRGTLRCAKSAPTTVVGGTRCHSTFADVSRIAASAGSAREAVTLLAAESALEVPQRHSHALVTKIEALVARNDKAGVAAVAHELVAARQNRLQAQLIPLVVESCRAIGFVPTGFSTASGLISANRHGTRQCMNIDVAKTKDGGIQIHLDAEGFEGAACVETLNSFQAELHKRGVHCDLQERRRKPSRPVRIGQAARIRLAN
jgi:hypothetical protein